MGLTLTGVVLVLVIAVCLDISLPEVSDVPAYGLLVSLMLVIRH